jgi:hypothetical protein
MTFFKKPQVSYLDRIIEFINVQVFSNKNHATQIELAKTRRALENWLNNIKHGASEYPSDEKLTVKDVSGLHVYLSQAIADSVTRESDNRWINIRASNSLMAEDVVNKNKQINRTVYP